MLSGGSRGLTHWGSCWGPSAGFKDRTGIGTALPRQSWRVSEGVPSLLLLLRLTC